MFPLPHCQGRKMFGQVQGPIPVLWHLMDPMVLGPEVRYQVGYRAMVPVLREMVSSYSVVSQCWSPQLQPLELLECPGFQKGHGTGICHWAGQAVGGNPCPAGCIPVSAVGY